MWNEDDIQANGIKIHYRRTGGDKPPMILAHGYTDDGMCWVQIAKALENDYDLILLDAHGHGLSERADTPFTSNDLAQDIVAVIDVLGLEKVGLMGHSLGASTIAVSAMLAPQKVDYAVLIDPPWFDVVPDNRPTPEERSRRVREQQTKSLEELMAEGHRNMPTAHDDLVKAWAGGKLRLDTNIFDTLQIESEFFDWQTVAPQIECPFLLLIGEAERGGLVTLETAQKAISASKQGQYKQVANVGHLIHFEQFDSALQVIQEFLAEQ